MKTVLTTIANERYLDYAKQVFSSAYFSGLWRGDFLLLAFDDVSQVKLDWFRERNIRVVQVDPFDREMDFVTTINLAKIELFRDDFKEWDRVVYLDTDMIVQKPLGNILEVDGIGGVQGIGKCRVSNRLRRPYNPETKALFDQLRESFDIKAPGINGGFFCFNTDIINKETYKELRIFVRKYHLLFESADECTLALFFKPYMRLLPLSFNVYLYRYGMNHPEKAKGAILHFVGTGILPPWAQDSPFFPEWKQNFAMANEIKIEPLKLGMTPSWDEKELKATEALLRAKFIKHRLVNHHISKFKQSLAIL